ncbi:hypothetical protein QBC35DRAFT_502566 [Podospora australis]|uniref:Amine oxidase domain-containing protein n=1 Tax=Podospora australis TaxID=1536484 RepID=A0AAN6WQ00_9PEZI|nr:hypothetical protein QBC35DRAFT_502566 [Podospora australis]
MYATTPRCLVRNRCIAVSPSCIRSLSSLATRSTQHHISYPSTPHRPRTSRQQPPTLAALTRADAAGSPAISTTSNGKNRRCYATKNAKTKAPRSVAVLGGGLTGLSTAWYLTRFLPDAKITIYEASNRLGGWIDSEQVEVTTPEGEKGTVCFQRGARLIKLNASSPKRSSPVRYDDLVFIDLVQKLNLMEDLQLQRVKNDTLDSYVYYPDHLVRMPRPPSRDAGLFGQIHWAIETFMHLLREPVFDGAIPAVIGSLKSQESPALQAAMANCRHPDHDVSIGDFFEAQWGDERMINNLLSAMVHGIFGGDIWKLSLASSPFIHRTPMVEPIPLTQAWVRPEEVELAQQILRDEKTFQLAQKLPGGADVWFKDGLSVMTDALVRDLKANRNVTIKLGDPVTSVRYHEKTDSVVIRSPSQKRDISYEKAISTIFAKSLAGLCDHQLPSLEKSTATTIRVVNLWYPYPNLNAPNQGFGYLLPQSLKFEENPEFVLGVMFDSDREWRPDHKDPSKVLNTGKDTIHGTKLTVMMGGHYWDELPEECLPDAATAIEAAKKAVARHMGWPESFNDHVVASTKLCRDCIPQHLVGHAKNMMSARHELEWAFKGKLAVAGPSYQPPGVSGSLRAAYDIARYQAHGHKQQKAWDVGDTGLSRFGPPVWKVMDRVMFPLKFKSGAYVTKDGKLMPREELQGLQER